MDSTPNQTGLLWTQLRVPVQQKSIQLVQQAVCLFASSWHFSAQQLDLMELAIEESFNTILQLIHGDIDLGQDWAAAGEFQVRMRIKNGTLQVRITDDDLPYDFSMLPQFTPAELATENGDARGLSVFLLQNIVDKVQVLPPSVHGQSLLLEWLLPQGREELTRVAAASGLQTWQREDIRLRRFQQDDAIYVARLMHQNYGYTYVNSDLYIAEKICLRSLDGRLFSHVASTPNNELVGHCAIMKSHADDEVLELGAAVVAPHYQGLGIFHRLWESLEQLLPQRLEAAACVHAVSSHPYTQKIVLHHGYVMCALMLAYTPHSMQLKSMHLLQDVERGSVFYCCKLLKPIAPISVYLPEEGARQLQAIAHCLGMRFINQPWSAVEPSAPTTSIQYHVESALNIAYLYMSQRGADSQISLRQVLRQLCRARIDAVYALIDLSQVDARLFYQDLMELGFIGGGLTPYMPYPATLMLQYTNNQLLHEEAVFAVGDQAQNLKQQVFAAYRQQESL